MSASISDYLDLQQTEHLPLFEGGEYPWEALRQIEPYLKFRLKPAIHGRLIGKPFISEQVYIGPGTVVEPGAYIQGPAWIGANCIIRHGAYIRENVIVGDNCVLGNSCEFKNCILFNGCQVPHFSYVGDSVLGHKAHLGAGVILSNVRLDKAAIRVTLPGKVIETGLKKFGAIIGDGCEIGCQAVINPGSLIGRGAMVFPGTIWTGVLKPGGRGRKPS
jgi:NDP-sugar pyrophosphorylase family protein